jgi:RNA polymerase sigma-70 factor (ECF subfamily)
VDICNTVLGKFFVRAHVGRFNLESPRDLIKLLVTMARRRLVDELRKACNRILLLNGGADGDAVRDPGESPSEIVAGEELIQEFLRRMTPAERRIAELRAAYLDWGEVAARVGGSREAVRKQLERAVCRVEHQLGLREDGEA